MSKEIQIVDVGIGNISSIINMLKKIGANSYRVTKPVELKTNIKLILPGVGSFDAGITALKNQGMDKAINGFVQDGGILLGICLGMQLLFSKSEEGLLPGLNLINGEVKKIKNNGNNLKIPHMGWNVIKPLKYSDLFDLDSIERRYYFVHSYYCICEDPSTITAVVNYGEDFACAVQKYKVYGVQFHPEKSHHFGMYLLQKFVDLI